MRIASLVGAGLLATACAVPSSTGQALPASLAKEFAPTGVLRVGINYGNPVVVQKDAAGGAPRGVGPAMAREIARRLGVPVTYVTFDAAGRMADAVKQGAWDIAFLAVDPARATDIDFSAPYVLIEGTYMVPESSPLRTVDDMDRPGLRISVGNKSAYHLYLARHLKQATLVPMASAPVAVEALLKGEVDAAANVKQTLLAAARTKPGYRVMDTSFMIIGQAAGVPRGRPQAAAYLREFIEEAKAGGFVARELAASGIHDATVAPKAAGKL